MDQSDLLPRLKERINEATDAAELDQLREDSLTAWKHGDIMPSDVEDLMLLVRHRRAYNRETLAAERRKEIADCQTIEALNAAAIGVKQDWSRDRINQTQFTTLCDAGRKRREELTQ